MKKLFIASLLAAVALPALAETTVAEPWVRATVPAQKATGAFMRLSSDADARLVSASSPVANVVEVHEMAVVDNVMKMRQVEAVELPAGDTVELKPGSFHIMLMDLKAQVKEGDEVPITLVIEGKDGEQETVSIVAPARPLNAPAGGMQMKHGQ
ncbi:MAG: copper chaperone PCu(A)C [Thauera phenolivorans]|uniref:Copper chaperone PCu(A)C n=1 Tax=Thauera phenolivorans TaxID=1792543 RepID=A0A7X7LXW1_9RHOO|nr:copper chaperone PCu(A)C [Thauera phenolivorans]NLF55283.1 copper chaperone PCu(A)C [Thauera phenolivorans]